MQAIVVTITKKSSSHFFKNKERKIKTPGILETKQREKNKCFPPETNINDDT